MSESVHAFTSLFDDAVGDGAADGRVRLVWQQLREELVPPRVGTRVHELGVRLEREGLFERAGGYDTVYQGWGVEDDDLYSTLESLGTKQCRFQGSTASAIGHTDELRTRFYQTTRRVSHQVNHVYRYAKLDLMRMNRSLMPQEIRESMYSQIRSRFLQQHEESASRLDFDLGLPPVTIEAPDISRTLGRRPQTRIERRITYSVTWDDLKAE